MNTAQLECFLSVAESLSFARASEQLNISQPAVTHQIQSLENELGVKLFRRSTRRVDLTPEGRIFLDDARGILAITNHAIDRFNDPSERAIQTISIGCSSQPEMDMLPDVLHRLSEHHPNLHPNIVTLPGAQLISSLEDEALDAALTIRDPSYKKDALKFHELLPSPLCCVVREDHELADEEEVTCDDLTDCKLILYNPGSAAPEIARAQRKLAFEKGPSDIFYCETAEAAALLAGSGFGAAILPQVFVPKLPHMRSFVIPDAPEMSFGIYTRHGQQRQVVKDFVKFMKEELES